MIISGTVKSKQINKIIFCIMLFIFFTALSACNSKTNYKLISNNEYCKEIYNIQDTDLELVQMDFNTILNFEEAIPDEKYMIIFLSQSCEYSKQFINQFINHYNNHDYTFKKVYIFELNDYIIKNDKDATKDNREKFLKKFDIQSVPATLSIKNKKIFATEVGYYPENTLLEVIREFEKK